MSCPGSNSVANALLISSEKYICGPNLGYLTRHWSPFCQGAKFSDKSLKTKGLWNKTQWGSWPPKESICQFIHSFTHSFIYPVFPKQPDMWGTMPGDAGMWAESNISLWLQLGIAKLFYCLEIWALLLFSKYKSVLMNHLFAQEIIKLVRWRLTL